METKILELVVVLEVKDNYESSSMDNIYDFADAIFNIKSIIDVKRIELEGTTIQTK